MVECKKNVGEIHLRNSVATSKKCQVSEGETSRSLAERFGGHMSKSKSEQVRQGSFLHKHMWESHDRVIPPLSIEVLRRFPGDPALRQATETVNIRVNKPAMNGKEEWTNEPSMTSNNRHQL